MLGRAGVTRGVLVGVLMVVGDERGANPVLLGISVLLLPLALAGESLIARCWTRIGLEVQNFPEVDAEVVERFPRGLAMMAGSVALMLGLVSTALGLPSGITTLLVGVAFMIFVGVLLTALSRARRVVAAELHLPVALRAYAPEFVVYFSSTVGAAYQVGHVAAVLRADRSTVCLRHSHRPHAA